MIGHDEAGGIEIKSHEPDIIFKPLVNGKTRIRHAGTSINLPCAHKNIVSDSYVTLTGYSYTPNSRIYGQNEPDTKGIIYCLTI